MKWLEVIKIQTTQKKKKKKLINLSRECESCHGLLDIKVLSHVTVSDCLVWLLWDTNLIDQQGSGIALSLCNTLKKYGLIDHSVWMETTGEVENNHEK